MVVWDTYCHEYEGYFSFYSILKKNLVRRIGDTWETYVGQAWDEFPLDHIRTHFVHIAVLEVYAIDYNGFIEVEFYTGVSK